MGKDNHLTDEIDFHELITTLWLGRYLIAVFVTLFIGLGSLFLHNVAREYTVTMTLQPVSDENVGTNLQGLGGLASFAGISLPKGTPNDFTSFELLLGSEETASRLIKEDTLIQGIFNSEWDANQESFQAPAPGMLGSIISVIKLVLTGDGVPDYVAPNGPRLANYILLSLSVNKDSDTGFLVLSMEHRQPDLVMGLMSKLVRETDLLLKEKYVSSGASALEFYQAKITEIKTQEHRDALVNLMAKEEQKLMLASREGAFVAEAILGPSKSLRPTSPKNYLVLALSFVLGLLVGVGFVFIRKALIERKNNA